MMKAKDPVRSPQSSIMSCYFEKSRHQAVFRHPALDPVGAVYRRRIPKAQARSHLLRKVPSPSFIPAQAHFPSCASFFATLLYPESFLTSSSPSLSFNIAFAASITLTSFSFFGFLLFAKCNLAANNKNMPSNLQIRSSHFAARSCISGEMDSPSVASSSISSSTSSSSSAVTFVVAESVWTRDGGLRWEATSSETSATNTGFVTCGPATTDAAMMNLGSGNPRENVNGCVCVRTRNSVDQRLMVG
ncbi:hypothetical protein G7K_2815-t1 [Saitoella complicata NRRL Y-17804]|uniref:Uncharacterized protein n=1 Tax=Saitoella complicata (strain BCRC 22490 / CBS 7301 / JCM 7358 / NBRC 10748 / NRRL Y-17804) TaxID=698492 RepID=A0A0E9NGV7_SAICN|nr:hypothetical protein G7K_2815-t1 [Saitoella complicata NRRL Y-17804]